MSHVLITGATGVLGSEVLKVLVTQGHTVYALVRARNESHLLARKHKLLNYLNIINYHKSIEMIKADVTQNNWGVSDKKIKTLTDKVEYIIHIAGEVKLNQNEKEAFLNNVKPVEHLLDFWTHFSQIIKIDIVTTVGVGGSSYKLLPEKFLDKEPNFHNEYEHSKYKVEKLVQDSISRGVPITIHRPSMIVGDSSTGKVQSFQVFYHLCELITGRRTQGILPHLNHRRLDIIPVDIAAQGIAAIALDINTVGQVFNIASGKENSLPLEILAKKINVIFKREGFSSKRIYHLPDLLIKKIAKLNLESSLVILKKHFNLLTNFKKYKEMEKFILSLKYIFNYLFTDHSFENCNFKKYLKTIDVKIPNVDEYLEKVIQYYIKEKYRGNTHEKTVTKSFVREVKLIEFYRDNVWPIHRQFVRHQLTPRCKKCSLSEKVSKLKGGLCEYCRKVKVEKHEVNVNVDFDKMNREMEDLMLNKIGQAPRYDALVLFSGGKDSTYMVHRLRKDWPQIRILALTVDNTFLSPLAHDNIKDVIQKLEVDHQMLRPHRDLMVKMFSYAFTHLNEEGCYGTVDRFDGDFIHDVARNVAAQLEIPLIFSGLTPTQARIILNVKGFETDRELEMSKRQMVAGIRLEKVFSKEEMQWWWNGKQWSPQRVPHMIFPFCVWNLSEEKVKSEVVKAGLIKDGQQSPLLTNYQLIPLMGLVDMAQLGYSSFEEEFALNARNGKADPVLWRNTFEIVEYSAKTGLFINHSI
ncbi:MAG: SDR family oxidoreductase, partial [Bdellovibrionales bacterium]|nr:SDR family oxidoreductase [Bdellovibrionales bacterium]